MATTVKDLTDDPDGVFRDLWEQHGIPKIKNVRGSGANVTPVYNRGRFLERLEADREELDSKGMDDAPVYRGMARRAFMQATAAKASEKVDQAALEEMEQRGVIDSNVAERSTPLVFDPEILQALKDEAPLAFGRLARQGQEGYDAVFNRVDQRQSPLGRVDEGTARRLQDLARDFTLNRETVPMKIYADTAEVGDFAATASAHYMDLEDLTVTARMAEYAQRDEQEILYGRYELDQYDASVGSANEFDYVEGGGPTAALEGGSPVGDYATPGLAEWFRLADDAATNIASLPNTTHHIDKSAVSADILEDLKSEVRDLLQGPYATNPTDLEIWTSWTLYDTLENEFSPRARHDENAGTLNFGDYGVQVGGVTVYPSHNVDAHTYIAQDEDGTENDPWEEYDSGDTGYDDRTVGDPGDVFIVNTSTFRKRELAPLSSFPLAVRGAADEIGMVAYDANVELSGGFFGKYLSAYAI